MKEPACGGERASAPFRPEQEALAFDAAAYVARRHQERGADLGVRGPVAHLDPQTPNGIAALEREGSWRVEQLAYWQTSESPGAQERFLKASGRAAGLKRQILHETTGRARVAIARAGWADALAEKAPDAATRRSMRAEARRARASAQDVGSGRITAGAAAREDKYAQFRLFAAHNRQATRSTCAPRRTQVRARSPRTSHRNSSNPTRGPTGGDDPPGESVGPRRTGDLRHISVVLGKWLQVVRPLDTLGEGLDARCLAGRGWTV